MSRAVGVAAEPGAIPAKMKPDVPTPATFNEREVTLMEVVPTLAVDGNAEARTTGSLIVSSKASLSGPTLVPLLMVSLMSLSWSSLATEAWRATWVIVVSVSTANG